MSIQKIYTDRDPVCAYAESRIGGREENQDSYGYVSTPGGYAVTVCDGMGGGPGGKTASTIAVQNILTALRDAPTDERPATVVTRAVQRANRAIRAEAARRPELRGMGSTATVLYVTAQHAVVAHVGDSRVYQLRGGRKAWRTDDHSLVFDMVRNGVITEEQARCSAQSNVITRALGIKDEVDVEVHELPYLRSDRFVLCTDGIHGTMPEPQLVRLLSAKMSSTGAVADSVATTVDALGQQHGGGHDNLTLAVVDLTTASKQKPAMTTQTKIILLALAALLVLSLGANVYQFRAAHADNAAADSDSTQVTATQTIIDMIKSQAENASAQAAQPAAKPAKPVKVGTDNKGTNK